MSNDHNTLNDDHAYTGPMMSGFLDYVSILAKWRTFLLVNVCGVTLIAVIVSLLLPKWYKATASILPPKDQSLLNLFSSTNSVLKGLTSIPKLGGLGQNTGAYNY